MNQSQQYSEQKQNKRQLWQILNNKLSLQKDKQQFYNWLQSLPKLNVHNKQQFYNMIYFKITIIVLVYEMVYIDIWDIVGVSVGYQQYTNKITQMTQACVLYLEGLYFIDNWNLQYFYHLFMQLAYFVWEMSIGIYNFGIQVFKYGISWAIDLTIMFIWPVSLLTTILIAIKKISFLIIIALIIKMSLQIKNIEKYAFTYQKYISFISHIIILLFLHIIVGNLLPHLLINKKLIEMATCCLFLSNCFIGHSDRLSVLTLLIFSNYAIVGAIQAVICLMILAFTQIKQIKTQGLTRQQYSNNNGIQILGLGEITFANIIAMLSNRVNCLIILHIILLLISKQYKLMLAFIVLIIVTKCMQKLDHSYRFMKTRQIQHLLNSQQSNYIDYRSKWDIKLPIHQYH